jgi:hypothetical protein
MLLFGICSKRLREAMFVVGVNTRVFGRLLGLSISSWPLAVRFNSFFNFLAELGSAEEIARSDLRSGKRYDKNATASGPRRGMMSLYLLNHTAIVRASRSWILPLFHDFVRFFSSLLGRSNTELNGKGILTGRFVVKRFFAYIKRGLGVA